MTKRTKQFDTLKEAKSYEKAEKRAGRKTSIRPHREHMSYRGKNKTFYDVSSED